MADRIDRLYELLPVVYRQRDEGERHALRDLLRIVAEQVEVLEEDITRMYDDWFIETCQDWVVPYIGELVGYPAIAAASDVGNPPSPQRSRALTPRRDVANHLRYLRRRGTLALLELLASDSANLSGRAVEFYALLGRTQSMNHVDERGRLLDLRDGDLLDRIDSPFDAAPHTVDIRGVNAPRNPGRHNIPSAAAYLWRLRAYPVTHAPAYFLQRASGFFFYTFSALGNDAPLFTNAQREPEPTSIAGELHVPAPIRRRALQDRLADYYGPGRSFTIWIDDPVTPVPAENLIVADLTDWAYRPPAGKVAVDPKLGRIAVAKEPDAMWVTYRYGFSGDVGAHESPRPIAAPRGAVVYRVGAGETHATINDALDRWRDEQPEHAVVEIADSGVYTEAVAVELAARTTLQLRAANRCRPVLSLLDYHASRGEALHVLLNERSRFTLDGLVVAGRPLRVEGAGEKAVDARVVVRRATLVPGWTLRPDCTPGVPNEASIDAFNLRGKISVESSIVGTIAVMNETVEGEPLRIDVRDSIVDATSNELEAVVGPGRSYAWATLHVERCTIFGTVLVHAIELAENSIFGGVVRVARRQLGCIRFCWVPPGSRTPRRYHCQPDLVDEAAGAQGRDAERLRVAPRFSSVRFGAPDYCQLAFDCAPEIVRGADDESELGAFHDLFLPQRVDNLRARLDHATPAGMETGIIYAD